MFTAMTEHFYHLSGTKTSTSGLGSSYGGCSPLYRESEGSLRGSSTGYSFLDRDYSSSDESVEELHQEYGDYVVFVDEPFQNSSSGPVKEEAPLSKLEHSAGNEPDHFVKFFVVKLRGNSVHHQDAQCISCDHLLAALRGNPKSVTFNSSGYMVVQARDEEQSWILSQTTVLGGIAVTISPHLTLNNVSGVIESDMLWKEGTNTDVVQQLAHEGVVYANINDPATRQDGSVSLLVDVTFKNRSKLPIFVETRKGYQVEVRARVSPPKQCMQCFRFGHETFQCYENSRICENCAGDRDDHSSPCEKKTYCANCGSSHHGALSRHCFVLHKAWRINIVALSEDVDFGTAKRLVDAEIEECQSIGKNYVEEFPLSTRYFLSMSRNSIGSTTPTLNLSKSHGSPNLGGIEYSPNQPQPTNSGFPTGKNLNRADRTMGSWKHFSGHNPGNFTNEEEYYEYFGAPYVDFFESPGQVVPDNSPTSAAWNPSCSTTGLSSKMRAQKRKNGATDNWEWAEICDDSSPNDWHNLLDSIYADCVSELVDPMTLQIDVHNRYSNMVLQNETIFENDTDGLQNFLQSNIISSTFCWKRPTTADEASIESSSIAGSSASVLEGGVDCLSNQLANSTGGFDDCTDMYAAFRCKRVLRGRDCDGTCEKTHKLPRDDGIRCILQKFGQCYQGKKCIYLHDVGKDSDDGEFFSTSGSDSDSDDDEKRYLSTVMSVGYLMAKMNPK